VVASRVWRADGGDDEQSSPPGGQQRRPDACAGHLLVGQVGIITPQPGPLIPPCRIRPPLQDRRPRRLHRQHHRGPEKALHTGPLRIIMQGDEVPYARARPGQPDAFRSHGAGSCSTISLPRSLQHSSRRWSVSPCVRRASAPGHRRMGGSSRSSAWSPGRRAQHRSGRAGQPEAQTLRGGGSSATSRVVTTRVASLSATGSHHHRACSHPAPLPAPPPTRWHSHSHT
jgi:hypothetical protein